MTEATPAPAASPSLVSRAVGIIFSPGATFAQIIDPPRPLGILLLVAVVVGVMGVMPYFTEGGRQAMLEAQVQGMEQFVGITGQEVTDEMVDQMAERIRSPLTIAFGFVGSFVFMTLAALFFGALFWGLFNAIMGGTASFKQVLTVVTHGMVILALATVVSTPIMLMQGEMSMTGPFNLGALLPMLDESSFLARLLSGMNPFSIWQTIVVAIGLATLYKRKVGSIAIGLLVAYVLFTAAIVTVFGTFMGLGG